MIAVKQTNPRIVVDSASDERKDERDRTCQHSDEEDVGLTDLPAPDRIDNSAVLTETEHERQVGAGAQMPYVGMSLSDDPEAGSFGARSPQGSREHSEDGKVADSPPSTGDLAASTKHPALGQGLGGGPGLGARREF